MRGSGGGEPVDVLHGHDGQTVAHTLDRESDSGHPPRAHGHHRALDRFGRHPGFVPFKNVVELDAEAVGEASDTVRPTGISTHRAGT